MYRTTVVARPRFERPICYSARMQPMVDCCARRFAEEAGLRTGDVRRSVGEEILENGLDKGPRECLDMATDRHDGVISAI